MILGVVLPALGAMALGGFLPLALARLLPERRGALALNALVSVALMAAVSMAYFAAAYGARDPAMTRALLARPEAAAWHFGRLAALSAFLWGPAIALSLMEIHRRWRDARR